MLSSDPQAEITWLDGVHPPPTSHLPLWLSMGSTLMFPVSSDFNLSHIVRFSPGSQTQPCCSCPVLVPRDPTCLFGSGEHLGVHIPLCCFSLACELVWDCLDPPLPPTKKKKTNKLNFFCLPENPFSSVFQFSCVLFVFRQGVTIALAGLELAV